MSPDKELLAALRNSAEVARFCEAADVESCPNSIVIRALNLCAMGTTLIVALDLAWSAGYPIDTPASEVLTGAYDRLICEAIEANF